MTDDRPLTSADLGVEPGRDATLVELSSTFCQPCRAARTVLQRVVGTTDGVRLVELDVARPLGEALGRRFEVLSTPTTLVLDARGVVRHRSVGVPRLAQVRAALASVRGEAVGPGDAEERGGTDSGATSAAPSASTAVSAKHAT